MSVFRHHPDGRIIIDDLVIPLADFQVLEPGYPALPAGVTGFEYIQAGRHFAYGHNGQRAAVVANATLDGYIASRATYEAALAPPAPEPPSKAEASTIVDDQAEAARLQYITPGSGQAMVYERKRSEAEAWVADLSPDPADYPLLKARAERLNPGSPDYPAVATEWNAKAATWLAIAADIEGIREGAKEAIAATADGSAGGDDRETILAGLAWPEPGP